MAFSRRTFRRHFLSAVAILAAGIASAQTPGGAAAGSAEAADPPATVERTFRVASLDGSRPEGLHFATEGRDVELEFRRFRRSQDYEYVGPPTMTFFTRSVTEDGTIIRTPVGVVEVAPEENEVFILFLTTDSLIDRRLRQTTLPYSLLWLDDSRSGFPFGSIRVVNACGASLIGKVGDEELLLPYSCTPPMDFDEIDINDNGWIPFAFAIKTPEGYEIVYRNEVQFSEADRTLLILRPPRRARSLRIQTFLIEQADPEAESEEEAEASES
ncbi:MAG: hypothetical protein ACFB21_03950 [Opitutales bacterium]